MGFSDSDYDSDSISNTAELVKLLFETGSLKLIPRSGWFKIGIKEPESVAEHSFRTAIISFIIAKEETGNLDMALKSAFLGLIHDLHESRTLDLHKVAKIYSNVNTERAKQEQLTLLGIEDDVKLIGKNKDISKFVDDADKIELLLQAKEYSEQNPSAMLYVKELNLVTETGKKLAEAIKKADHRWWLDLEVHMR